MSSIEKTLERASRLRRDKKIDEAHTLLTDLLYEAHDDWRVWMQLGHLFIARSEYPQAVEAFREATLLNPSEYKPWLSLGYALRENDDLKGAIEATEKARNLLDEGSKEVNCANYNLACYHSLNGTKEEALRYLKLCLARDENIKKWAKKDKDLDPLRFNPRFKALLA